MGTRITLTSLISYSALIHLTPAPQKKRSHNSTFKENATLLLGVTRQTAFGLNVLLSYQVYIEI